MKAFLLEVRAAMREGPTLYFAPIQCVIKAIRHVKNAPVLRRGRGG